MQPACVLAFPFGTRLVAPPCSSAASIDPSACVVVQRRNPLLEIASLLLLLLLLHAAITLVGWLDGHGRQLDQYCSLVAAAAAAHAPAGAEVSPGPRNMSWNDELRHPIRLTTWPRLAGK